ncbi:MAG: PAS domain S-box protein, partial [Planctomycetota bacterium]
EFLQMRPQDVDARTRSDQFDSIMSTLLQKGNVTFQTEHRASDGSTVPVEINSQVFSLGDSKRILSVARDITERKRAAERHSQVVETTADGFWMVDLEGQIKEVNDSYCEMVGYSREELLGMSISDIQADDSDRDISARIQKIIEQGHHRFETRHSRKDGGTISVEISASYFEPGGGRIFAFLRDITERKKAEERLRIRDRAIQSSLNGIAIVDLDGNICSANPAALDMWGYEDTSALIGTQADALWNSHEKATDAFERAIEHGQWRGEMTAEKRDGTPFQVQAALSSIPGEDGDVAYVVGVFQDISDRKEAENRLREAYGELRETKQRMVDQERQRALSQMASGIAHDFNNALSPIRGYAELLLRSPEKLENPGMVKRYLRDIKTAADHAAETVRRMRKFYRPGEEWEHEPLDVNSVVQEAISMARPRWKQEAQAEGINIEMRTSLGDIPALKGNQTELHEILTNLLFNAVDAMEDDGCIEVATRTRDEDAIVIEVSDTGHGMDEQTLQHCLDPFYTTKAETGTGLGLSVTQSIARRHGGHVEAESVEGEGSTFRVILPAGDVEEEPEEETCTRAEQEETGAEYRALEILVVEDEDMQRELITQMLRSDGHTVDAAANGTQGLQKFSEGWYNLVLTDRAMPEMGGDELAHMVKDAAPDKPVVMLTGFGEMMEAAEEHPENVDAVVSKPVSQQKLRRAFDQVLEGSFVPPEEISDDSSAPEHMPADDVDSESDEDIDSLLQSLHERLVDNDLQATELAPRVARELSGTACGEEAEQLADTVHSFDFAPARQLLHEIAEDLDVSLNGQDP